MEDTLLRGGGYNSNNASGRVENVTMEPVDTTMEPGDMVLYKSHSVLHGRPFPSKKRYMAIIFIGAECDSAAVTSRDLRARRLQQQSTA